MLFKESIGTDLLLDSAIQVPPLMLMPAAPFEGPDSRATPI
jgi:hypothetical protein